MMHVGKRLLACGMAISISFCVGAGAERPLPKAGEPTPGDELPVPGEESPSPEPRLMVPCMARVPKTMAKLSISKKGKARLSGTIKKDSSITRIAGTVSLEKYSPGPKKWREVKVWKVKKNASSLSVSYRYQFPKKKKKGMKRGKYRVRVRMLVYERVGERGMPAVDFSKTRKY